MATSLQTLIPLLSSIALLITAASAGRTPSPPLKETHFKYNFRHETPTDDLTFQGDAHLVTDPAALRLTRTDDSGNPQPDSIGRVVYTPPVDFYRGCKLQASFESKIQFIIWPPYNGACGPADGLVFFLAPVDYPIGDGGGSFGVFNSETDAPIFAVEFDTYPNEGDPNTPHVGIDIGSLISRNVTEVGDELLGQKVTALIRYDAITKCIIVQGNAGSRCFEVSYEFDLSTILPEQVQPGLAAATGGCVAVHDVYKWSFRTKLEHVF